MTLNGAIRSWSPARTAARKPAAPKQKLELRQTLFNRVLVVVVDTTMSHLPAARYHVQFVALPTGVEARR